MAHEYEVFIDMGDDDGTMTVMFTKTYAQARAFANRLIEGRLTSKDKRNMDGPNGPVEKVGIVCEDTSGYTPCDGNCGIKKDRAYYKAHPVLKAKHKAMLKAALKAELEVA